MNYLKPRGNIRKKKKLIITSNVEYCKVQVCMKHYKSEFIHFLCILYDVSINLTNIQIDLGNCILDPYTLIPNGLNNLLESINLYNL